MAKQDYILIETQEQAIEFSKRLLSAFENKTSLHNEEYDTSVNVGQLEEVYKKGVESFNDSLEESYAKNEWGIARINMFLRITTGNMNINSEKIDYEDKALDSPLDLFVRIRPNEEDFTSAKKDIQKYQLNFSFNTIDDLFLTPPTKSNLWIEIE